MGDSDQQQSNTNDWLLNPPAQSSQCSAPASAPPPHSEATEPHEDQWTKGAERVEGIHSKLESVAKHTGEELPAWVEPGVQAAVGPVNVRDDYNKMQSDASHGNYLGATRDGVSATKDYAATVGAGAKIASTIAPKLLGPGAARLAAGAGPAGMVIGAGATGLAIGNTMCDIADSDMSRRSYYGKNAAGQDQTPMERASQLGVQTEDALAKRGHPTLGKVAGAGVAGFESIPAGIIGTAQAAPQIASTGVTMLGMATGFGANDPIDSATGLKQSEINQLAAQGATSQDPNAVAAVKAQREAALQQTVDPRNQ